MDDDSSSRHSRSLRALSLQYKTPSPSHSRQLSSSLVSPHEESDAMRLQQEEHHKADFIKVIAWMHKACCLDPPQLHDTLYSRYAVYEGCFSSYSAFVNCALANWGDHRGLSLQHQENFITSCFSLDTNRIP